MLLAIPALLALLFAACGGDDVSSDGTPSASATTAAASVTPSAPAATPTITPTAAPSPTAVPTVPGYPAEKRTGIAGLDAVLDTLFSRDAARIAAQLQLVQVGCVAQSAGIGSPPICQGGAAPGTKVDAYPTGLGCEGGFVLPQTLFQFAGQLVPLRARVYAIVKREPRAFVDGAFQLPAGEYAIVLAYPSPAATVPFASIVIHVTGDRIVTSNLFCGQSPAQRVEGTPPSAFILAPP